MSSAILLRALSRMEVEVASAWSESESSSISNSASSSHTKDDAQPIQLMRTAHSHAIRAIVELLCSADLSVNDAAPIDSASGASWTLLAEAWPRVRSIIDQLHETAHPTPSSSSSSSTDATSDDNRQNIPMESKRRGKRGARGGGGHLPPAEQERLKRQRAAIQLEQKLWLWLEATTCIARTMGEQVETKKPDSDEHESRGELLLSMSRGVTELLHPTYVSSHDSAATVLFSLCQLWPPLRTRVEKCCIDYVHNGGNQPLTSQPSIPHHTTSTFEYIMTHAHPRAVCILLKQLLLHTSPTSDANGMAPLDQAVWQAILHSLQHSTPLSIRQPLLRIILPTLLETAQNDTGSLIQSRYEEMYDVLRDIWIQATTPSQQRHPLISDPLLSSNYLNERMQSFPQLLHVFDLLCTHIHHMWEAVTNQQQRHEMNEWILQLCLCGLSSDMVLAQKQSIYLLQTRLALREQSGDHDHDDGDNGGSANRSHASEQHHDYSVEQWTAFQQLYTTLDGTTLHLVQSVMPRIDILLGANRSMDEWLELILTKGLTHAHPSIAGTVFQYLYDLGEREWGRWKDEGCVGSIDDRATSLPRLPPTVILGAVLRFFNDPSHYAMDKERSAPRLGDTLLVPFLHHYIERFPKQHSKAGVNRAGLLRTLLLTVCRDSNMSLQALTAEFQAMSEVTPTYCFGEDELEGVLHLLQSRVLAASNRVRPSLLLAILQIICRHGDFSTTATAAAGRPISLSTLSRIIESFPSSWLRPGCASLTLLQNTINSNDDADDDGGWLERHLPQAIAAQIHSTAVSSDAIDANSQMYEKSSFNSRLMRMILLVPEHSKSEKQLLHQMDEKLTDAFNTILNVSSSTASLSSLHSLYHLLDLLHTLHSTFVTSRQHAIDASMQEADPALETVCVSESASSKRFLTDDPSHLSDASSATANVGSSSVVRQDMVRAAASTSWQGRLQWSQDMLNRFAVPSMKLLQETIDASEEPDGSTHEEFIRPLIRMSEQLLQQDSLKSLRHRLLIQQLRRFLDERFMAKQSASSRLLTFGLLHACINPITSDAFDASSDPSSTPAAGASSSDTVEEWLKRSAENPSQAETPLPTTVVPVLCHRIITAQFGRKPDSVSNAEWKATTQRFYVQRWQMVQRLLEVCPQHCTCASLLPLCVEALDGCTASFAEHIYHCIRILMPMALEEEKRNKPDAVGPVSWLDPLYSAAWTSFRDVHADFEGYGYQQCAAFLAVLFEPSTFALDENHRGEDAPFRKHFKLALSFGQRHSRFLVYLTFFATLSWTRVPHVLGSYPHELLQLCMFHPEMFAEVEWMEEKMQALSLAHTIHNFTYSTNIQATKSNVEQKQMDIVASSKLRRAESLVRIVSLSFIQHIPALMQSMHDQKQKEELRRFLCDFAEACINHPKMLSEKGGMMGEGNDEFICKLYLWQTLCVFVPSVAIAGEHRMALHDRLQQHAWTWFERQISSVLRHLLEVFFARLYAMSPDRIAGELAPRLRAAASRPTLLASLVVILGFATLRIDNEEKRSSQAKSTLVLLHPYVGCNFGHVRLVVQYLYHRIAHELLPNEFNVGESSSDLDTSCMHSLLHYLSADADLQRLRQRQDMYFKVFNPQRSCAVEGLMAGETDEHHHFIHQPIVEQVNALQAEYLSSLRTFYDDHDMDVAAPVATSAAVSSPSNETDRPLMSMPADTATSQSSHSQASAMTGSNLQQKVDLTPLARLSAISQIAEQQMLEAEEKQQQPSAVSLRGVIEQRISAPRQSVIVIASLVNKLPNLAGLARTCEIFQADRLLVADESIQHDPEFQTIAVTAHKWINIQQLKPEEIATFMTERQKEGYTCIALEQSATSIALPSYQFPRRVVILLGAEKEGVPVELLNRVDQSVEIPQKGIIRSLNVHVSASILLWEYTRQKLLGIAAPL